MEDLTADEAELFSLIQYFRNHYTNVKNKQGGLHPDNIEIQKVLHESQLMLIKIVQSKKEAIQQKQTPVVTKCPQCEIQKPRKPESEEKSEHGYMCNNYTCDECNIEYLDFTPNNAKDQLHWVEELSATILKQKAELKNANSQELDQLLEQLKTQEVIFKQACEKEEKAFKEYTQAQEAFALHIADWRDYLLIAKLKNQSPNKEIGKS